MTDTEFEDELRGMFPEGRQTAPLFWNDTRFNNPAQPVVGICWHEARAYCAWLNTQTNKTFRLPSEAEWEAAARGGTTWRYPYGDDFDNGTVNTFEAHIRRTTPVGVFPAGDSVHDLSDMSGNVWEWAQDCWHDSYEQAPEDGSPWLDTDNGDCSRRVLRGGSWNYVQRFARSAYRDWLGPSFRLDYIGFRLWCSPP